MALIDKINEIADLYKGEFENTLDSVPDWFIANKLNEPSQSQVSVYENILCNAVKGILILSGEYASIKIHAQSTPSSPAQLLCSNILSALDSFQYIEINNPDYHSGYINIANNLLLANIISQSTYNQLSSLVVSKTITVYGESWAQENNLQIDSRIVGIARGANPGE